MRDGAFSFLLNYDLAKRNLEVPQLMDFSLSFEYQNGTLVGNEINPPNTNVYSDDMRINYLSADAETEIGVLRVKMW